ncbi:MAG: hypothetical protein P8J33_11320, partial [Pirellulaceae bacterium]|nr:hypothetical protein [Pirellulaceae bacterium]
LARELLSHLNTSTSTLIEKGTQAISQRAMQGPYKPINQFSGLIVYVDTEGLGFKLGEDGEQIRRVYHGGRTSSVTFLRNG